MALDDAGALVLGVLWGIMVGVYVTYKVLNYADLTVDGSFTLGGAMSAVYVASGVPPVIAVFLATLGGMVAGLVTGILHTKFKIPDLLAGILCQFGLYSVNLRIMGKANFAILNQDTVFTQIQTRYTGKMGGLCCRNDFCGYFSDWDLLLFWYRNRLCTSRNGQ